MPCLEEVDNRELAQQHITAQAAVISNLRSRLAEMEGEQQKLVKQGADLQTSDRLKQVHEAVKHLRLELNGEIETEPGSMKFRRDTTKKPQKNGRR
jgi:uncharacterized protein YhaN